MLFLLVLIGKPVIQQKEYREGGGSGKNYRWEEKEWLINHGTVYLVSYSCQNNGPKAMEDKGKTICWL